ncbi:MAG: PEP-CTERM sorting domain-containing protein [Pirellulaceae bacterium]
MIAIDPKIRYGALFRCGISGVMFFQLFDGRWLMRQFVSSLVMGLVATIATSSVSFAAMLTGGASFNNTLTDLTNPALPTASQILDFQTATTAAGDFTVGMGWGTLNISTYQVTNGTGMGPISGAAGDFSGTWTGDTWTPVVGNPSNGTRAMSFAGTMSRAGFDNTPALLNISVTKTGGFYSVAVTLAMNPPAAVPEPASLAIFGLGATGFAVRRFRRK